MDDGYEFFADRKLVTIFSAPNYCNEFDNAGAMLIVEDDLSCRFILQSPIEKSFQSWKNNNYNYNKKNNKDFKGKKNKYRWWAAPLPEKNLQITITKKLTAKLNHGHFSNYGENEMKSNFNLLLFKQAQN